MKNKIIINILFLFLSFFIKNNIYANEFTFDVTDIKILDNGNVIHANLGVAKSINNNEIPDIFLAPRAGARAERP